MNLQGQTAGFFSRFLAFVLDALLISGINFGMLLLTQTALDLFGVSCIIAVDPCLEHHLNQFVKPIALSLERIAPYLTLIFGYLVTIGYLLFFWSFTGQTPGKGQLGLRIVRLDGQKLRWREAILRLVGYGASFITFFVGFLLILVDKQHRGLHDQIGRTKVIYDWPAHPEETFLSEPLSALDQRDKLPNSTRDPL